MLPESQDHKPMDLLPKLKLGIRCACMAANALTALGIFTFPIIAPSLAQHLRLSQSQLSTIVLAGLAGQYPLASVAGLLVDHVGTWASSLVAFFLFTIGYGIFAWVISQAHVSDAPISPASFRTLVGCFFLLGLGGVNSYFSAVFSAAKQFPRHIGLATGATLALFGMSPFFLSLPAVWFTDESGTVDAFRFVVFLGVLSSTVHLISTLGLQGIPLHENESLTAEINERDQDADERTALLPTAPIEEVTREGQGWTDLLSDVHFWWLWITILLSAGSAEMVMGNIGSILNVLPMSPSASLWGARSVSAQVQLISACNTVIRFVTGALIDYFSPPPFALGAPRNTISRLAFLWLACVLLACIYGYVAIFVQYQSQVWVLSVGAGIAYGAIWTVIPSITKIAWGEANVGRNFGLISYAPFLGTPLWTFLFAFDVDHESAGSDQQCRGPKCWRLTFQLATVALLGTAAALIPLWKKWKHKV